MEKDIILKFSSEMENSDYDEFSNMESYFCNIYLRNLETKQCVKIGETYLILVKDPFWYDDKMSLFSCFDSNSATQFLGEAIVDVDFDVIKDEIKHEIGQAANNNILIGESIFIKSEYRNKGYGKKVLETIEAYFKPICGYIALQSFPKQHDVSVEEISRKKYNLDLLDKDYETAQSSLNKFYENCGFVKVDCTHIHAYIKNISSINSLDLRL